MTNFNSLTAINFKNKLLIERFLLEVRDFIPVYFTSTKIPLVLRQK